MAVEVRSLMFKNYLSTYNFYYRKNKTDEGGLWKWSVFVSVRGLLYWRPRRICYVRLRKWVSVSIVAPFGEHGGRG
jgi:hypothetical protein